MTRTECAHCESFCDTDDLGLCARCGGITKIRELYVRRRGWTPAWEEHLRKLRRRARARLPLFSDHPMVYDLVTEPHRLHTEEVAIRIRPSCDNDPPGMDEPCADALV